MAVGRLIYMSIWLYIKYVNNNCNNFGGGGRTAAHYATGLYNPLYSHGPDSNHLIYLLLIVIKFIDPMGGKNWG